MHSCTNVVRPVLRIGIVFMRCGSELPSRSYLQVLRMLENPKIIYTVIHISGSLYCFIFLVFVIGFIVFNSNILKFTRKKRDWNFY
jgi:hypothetical protein